jgi:hypothetical protein
MKVLTNDGQALISCNELAVARVALGRSELSTFPMTTGCIESSERQSIKEGMVIVEMISGDGRSDSAAPLKIAMSDPESIQQMSSLIWSRYPGMHLSRIGVGGKLQMCSQKPLVPLVETI